MRGYIHTSLICAAFLLLTGCSTKRYAVSVDALGQAHTEKRYVVLSPDPSIRPDDLYFREFAGRVAGIMRDAGYTVVGTRPEADAAVLLSYGVSGPEYAGGQIYPARSRLWPGMGYWGYERYDSYRLRPYYGPDFSQSDYYRTPIVRLFARFVVLDAVDLKTAKPNSLDGVTSLWKVTMMSRGQNGNLREVFPYLLEAARPYLGQDTHGSVTVTVTPPEVK